jgi:hypothetical protein
MTYYKERAEECRRLAKLCRKPEDWAAFEKMAQTWDRLIRQRQDRLRWKTIARADGFRTALFLSDISAKESPKGLTHKNAA